MVSVIIPTTSQGFTHLARLLPLLSEECQETGSEIIIIDNASKDGTTNYLANYNCTVIVNKTNQGFSIANNRAVKIAQGDYLLFLNNDTYITKGFINEMVRVIESDEAIGMVGCLIMQMNEKKVQHAGVCFTKDYVAYQLGLEQPDIAPQIPFNDPRVHTVREVPAVTAACMLVKKEVFNQVNGFDERFKNGWEDVDLCLKVREAGFKIMYTGNTYVQHERFGSKNAGRFQHEIENRQLYDSIWVTTGKAKKVLGNFREG
jgi:GT2 family glycosyltransferase